MKGAKLGYAWLFDCKTSDDVERLLKAHSSTKSDREHVIRSAILDMHLRVEHQLRAVLYQHMHGILPLEEDENVNRKNRERLKKSLSNLSFGIVHRLLKPCLAAFADLDLGLVRDINRLRNQLAHQETSDVQYGGKNPFRDHECLAKFLFDCHAAMKALAHFHERMIEEPREECLDLHRRYVAKQAKSAAEQRS